jgi:DNA-directed RNA polymerase subunit RPC12/RpoP
MAYRADLNKREPDQMEWENTPEKQWEEDEATGLRTYICKSCGGEIVGDENLAAALCPYCDNPVVMKSQLEGALKPDLVIPFKLDKNAAKAALKKHLSGKRLLPKVFMDENHIDEIKGIYVPFWLFNAEADAEIRYKGTRVRTWSDRNYYYTETQHYHVERDGTLEFQNVPVDGSTKLDDKLMESIEPFFMSDAVDFQKAYLAGYLADKYDVDAQGSIDRANQRIRESTERMFADTAMGYTTLIPVSSGVQLRKSNAKYALLPVWILNTSWKGNKYTFAMNGQTGKFVGDLPMDQGAFNRWFFGIMGLTTAISLLISYLVWLF